MTVDHEIENIDEIREKLYGTWLKENTRDLEMLLMLKKDGTFSLKIDILKEKEEHFIFQAVGRTIEGDWKVRDNSVVFNIDQLPDSPVASNIVNFFQGTWELIANWLGQEGGPEFTFGIRDITQRKMYFDNNDCWVKLSSHT